MIGAFRWGQFRCRLVFGVLVVGIYELGSLSSPKMFHTKFSK